MFPLRGLDLECRFANRGWICSTGGGQLGPGILPGPGREVEDPGGGARSAEMLGGPSKGGHPNEKSKNARHKPACSTKGPRPLPGRGGEQLGRRWCWRVWWARKKTAGGRRPAQILSLGQPSGPGGQPDQTKPRRQPNRPAKKKNDSPGRRQLQKRPSEQPDGAKSIRKGSQEHTRPRP